MFRGCRAIRRTARPRLQLKPRAVARQLKLSKLAIEDPRRFAESDDPGAAKARAGRPWRFAEAVGARADCPAMLGPMAPPPNSLRSLRSLRSDSRRESDGRCALRARATSPALLGASEAHHGLPARAFRTICVRARLLRSEAHHSLPTRAFAAAPWTRTRGFARSSRHGSGAARHAVRLGLLRRSLAAGGVRQGRFPERREAQARVRRRDLGPSIAVQSARSADRSTMSPCRTPPAAPLAR